MLLPSVKVESILTQAIVVSHLLQGSEKMLSGCPRQIDFPAERVTFHSHLPIGQGLGQVVCQLN